MMTFAQLRCFLAVVDKMSFRRAAEHLNMTQPPLTRQIQALEHQVGTPLFERSARTIRLTPAGEHFSRSARSLMAQANQAMGDARRVADGARGSLTVGFTAASSYVFLPRLVALLRRTLPAVSLTLREMTSAQQARALSDGRIDLGISRPLGRAIGVQTLRVYREPLYAALPLEHEAGEALAVAIQAFAGETLITYPPVEGVYLHDLVTGLLHVHNVNVADVQHVTQTHSILALVGAGLGMALVLQSANRVLPQDVRLVPLREGTSACAELVLAWRAEVDNPATGIAVDCVRTALENPEWLR
jgi:DNA-binding transcriptional LysR family regulator